MSDSTCSSFTSFEMNQAFSRGWGPSHGHHLTTFAAAGREVGECAPDQDSVLVPEAKTEDPHHYSHTPSDVLSSVSSKASPGGSKSRSVGSRVTTPPSVVPMSGSTRPSQYVGTHPDHVDNLAESDGEETQSRAGVGEGATGSGKDSESVRSSGTPVTADGGDSDAEAGSEAVRVYSGEGEDGEQAAPVGDAEETPTPTATPATTPATTPVPRSDDKVRMDIAQCVLEDMLCLHAGTQRSGYAPEPGTFQLIAIRDGPGGARGELLGAGSVAIDALANTTSTGYLCTLVFGKFGHDMVRFRIVYRSLNNILCWCIKPEKGGKSRRYKPVMFGSILEAVKECGLLADASQARTTAWKLPAIPRITWVGATTRSPTVQEENIEAFNSLGKIAKTRPTFTMTVAIREPRPRMYAPLFWNIHNSGCNYLLAFDRRNQVWVLVPTKPAAASALASFALQDLSAAVFRNS